MDNPKEYIEVNKDWFWFLNDMPKEEFPLDQFVEREIPRCILIFEPIEEC